MDSKPNVLILCSKNSARSQMAVFRRVRDEISKRLESWLVELGVTPANKA